MKKIQSKKLLIVLGVVAALILLHFTGLLRPVERSVLSFFDPVSRNMYEASSFFKNIYGQQMEAHDRSRRIEELEKEVNRLTAENAELKTLREENEKLRRYLDFFEEKEHDHVLADIVSQEAFVNPQEENPHIVINKGENDGVKKGYLVVNEQGVVVGKVSSVGPASAELILVTNSESRLAASVQNSDRTSGVVEGSLGLTMEMNFIPQSEEVNVDDLVTTSGLEKDIPRGLAIGKVAEVEGSRNRVWQRATVEPLVDLDELTVVSVLVP